MLVVISTVTGAIMAAIVFIGSVGNFLTLFVIIRYRPLHDVTGMFLANLAVADLLQSIFGMPLIASSAFKNKWIFGDALCTISGVSNSLFCITSMLTLSAISVDRWLAIVYPLHHQTFLTIHRARVVIFYVWSHALLVALFPAFGWSRYIYLSYEFICTVQWEHDKAYTIFLSLTSFVAPLFLTIVSYASVMKVACHQAHETLPVTVGEIEAEFDHVTIHNSSRIPDASNARKQMKRVDRGPQARSNDPLFESYLKDNVILGAKAKLNTQLESQKADVKFHFSETEVTASSCTKSPTTMNASLIRNTELKKADYKPEHLLKKSARKKSRTKNKTETSRGHPGNIRKNNNKRAEKETKKERRKDSVDPAYSLAISGKNPALSSVNPEVFHEDPALYRLRSAWTSEDLFGSKLGIIPEEDETQDSRHDQTSLSHLVRVREWMAVKLKNKERTEALLQRRKEMKVVLTLAVVNGTFVLCWLPHFIGIMCLTFTNGSCPFSDNFFVITTMLAMLNSGCNPFIYTLTYRKFRKAFKQVLSCFRRSNSTRNIDNSVN